MAQQGPQHFDAEDKLPVHGPAIADGPDATLAAASDRIDQILAALRSANIIAE